MANLITAITTGSGGLATTADASGAITFQKDSTTLATLDASGNLAATGNISTATGNITATAGTVTAANFSGNGSGLTSVSGSAMTLLGTVTPTVTNSISLGSLTLTSYKSLFIIINSVAVTTGKIVFISSTNSQTGGGFPTNTSNVAVSGTAWLDLGTGVIGGGLSDNTTAGASNSLGLGGLTDVTTASTTIYFRAVSTNNFVAGGSIKIYGVK